MRPSCDATTPSGPNWCRANRNCACGSRAFLREMPPPSRQCVRHSMRERISTRHRPHREPKRVLVPDTLLPAAKLADYAGPTVRDAATALAPGDVAGPLDVRRCADVRAAGRAARRHRASVRDGARAGRRGMAQAADGSSARPLPRGTPAQGEDPLCGGCATGGSATVSLLPAPWRMAGLLAALVACGPASAHTRSQSFSSWAANGPTLTAVFQVDARRVTQLDESATLDGLGTLLAKHLGETVSVAQEGRPCAASSPRPLVAVRGDVRVELSFTCARPLADVPATVVMGAFFEVSPSHVHYARTSLDGGPSREVLVTVRSHTFEVGGHGDAAPTDFAAFFRLGLEHVLSGLDHLAFVAALALLAGGFGRAVWAATGFTLGHSLTLGLVAMGLLRPDVPAIESLIGFTVAFAAAEAFALRAAPRAGWITIALVAAIPLAAMLAGVSGLPWTVVARHGRLRPVRGWTGWPDVAPFRTAAGCCIRTRARRGIRRRAAWTRHPARAAADRAPRLQSRRGSRAGPRTRRDRRHRDRRFAATGRGATPGARLLDSRALRAGRLLVRRPLPRLKGDILLFRK